jgi:hypothetical protein
MQFLIGRQVQRQVQDDELLTSLFSLLRAALSLPDLPQPFISAVTNSRPLSLLCELQGSSSCAAQGVNPA